VSMIDTQGGPFHDPVADKALIDNLKAGLHGNIEVNELDMDLNDPRFARAMASRLDQFVQAQGHT
jgi:uncharacterized protein (UPF0261 family)